jgi:hypothetical protein
LGKNPGNQLDSLSVYPNEFLAMGLIHLLSISQLRDNRTYGTKGQGQMVAQLFGSESHTLYDDWKRVPWDTGESATEGIKVPLDEGVVLPNDMWP